jgi:hypothetical protein
MSGESPEDIGKVAMDVGDFATERRGASREIRGWKFVAEFALPDGRNPSATKEEGRRRNENGRPEGRPSTSLLL